MARLLGTPGFVGAVPLTSRTTARISRTQRCAPLRPTPVVASRRRSRVVALGGAAPPPPPPPGDEGAEEASAAAAPPADDEVAESVVAGEDEAPETGADDILSSPVFLKKKLEVIQKELAEAKAAAEAAEDAMEKEKGNYVRLAADFENFRRRSGNDLLAQESKATAKVCKEVLTVLDNFERAIAAVQPETDKEASINSSYQAINKQLLDALVKLKVTPIESVGEVFDPELHDAIQNAQSDEYPEGVVCAQFQRGYTIGDSLIRAAMVVVSEGPGPADAGDEAVGSAEGEASDEAAGVKGEEKV